MSQNQKKMNLKENDWNRSENTPDFRLKTADASIGKAQLNLTAEVIDKENKREENRKLTTKKKSQSERES